MRAPNSFRAGVRRTSTRATATAAARFAATRTRRASLIVEVRDQLLEELDVLGGQGAVLGEMGDQRRHLAVEEAVDQALALGLDVVAAAEQGPVEIALSLAPALDGLLAQQAGDQGLHGA